MVVTWSVLCGSSGFKKELEYMNPTLQINKIGLVPPKKINYDSNFGFGSKSLGWFTFRSYN